MTNAISRSFQLLAGMMLAVFALHTAPALAALPADMQAKVETYKKKLVE